MAIQCRVCEATVVPQKRVKKRWIAFWILLVWPVAIIYAMTAPANNCPNCNNNVYRG